MNSAYNGVCIYVNIRNFCNAVAVFVHENCFEIEYHVATYEYGTFCNSWNSFNVQYRFVLRNLHFRYVSSIRLHLWRLFCSYHILGFLNTLRPRHNGRHFADDILNSIFLNENVWIPIKISLKFVPEGPIDNIPSLVQIVAWRRPGGKPLSEPMMVSLTAHICVTLPQWVKPARQHKYCAGFC